MRETVFNSETLKIRQAQFITALAECAWALCEFNVTRDMVLGKPVKRTDGAEYSLCELLGLSPGCTFTDFVRAYSESIAPDQRGLFIAFSDPEHLKRCYEQGHTHIDCIFLLNGKGGKPVPFRQSILLYEDAESGDLLGLTYAQALPPRDICREDTAEKEPEWDEAARTQMKEHCKDRGGNTMTIKECYQEMGGSYDEVCKRLPSAGLIEKFVRRFPDDKSFDTLCKEMEAGNREEAFIAAHTLKGVCANLSFNRLFGSVERLTEELRGQTGEISDIVKKLFEEVTEDYKITISAILRFIDKA